MEIPNPFIDVYSTSWEILSPTNECSLNETIIRNWSRNRSLWLSINDFGNHLDWTVLSLMLDSIITIAEIDRARVSMTNWVVVINLHGDGPHGCPKAPPLILTILLNLDGKSFNQVLAKLFSFIIFKSHSSSSLTINVPGVSVFLNEGLCCRIFNL